MLIFTSTPSNIASCITEKTHPDSNTAVIGIVTGTSSAIVVVIIVVVIVIIRRRCTSGIVIILVNLVSQMTTDMFRLSASQLLFHF
jgi:hypothetical protein